MGGGGPLTTMTERAHPYHDYNPWKDTSCRSINPKYSMMHESIVYATIYIMRTRSKKITSM